MRRVVDSPGSREKAAGSTPDLAGEGAGLHLQGRVAGVGGHQGALVAVADDDVSEVEHTGGMQLDLGGHAGAVEQHLQGRGRAFPDPFETQGAAGGPARRGREGDAHRQRAQAVGGQQVLPVGRELREDGEVVARRVDAADGEVGVAGVRELDDAAARLAHGHAAEVVGRGPDLQEAARPPQLHPPGPGLGVDEEGALPEPHLLGAEGQLHAAALPRVEQQAALAQAELRAAVLLQLQAHQEGAAAPVPHEQRQPRRLAHGHAAEVDGRGVEELHLRRADLAAAGKGHLHARALRVVGGQQERGAGRPLVARQEADLHVAPGPGLEPQRRVPGGLEGLAGELQGQVEVAPSPVDQGEGAAGAGADLDGLEVDPHLGQGGDGQPRGQSLAAEGHRDAGQVRRVHPDPAPEGAVAGGPEEDADLHARPRRQAAAGRRAGEREGSVPGLDGEAVDDQLDPSGVDQLQGAAHDPPHRGRPGVDALRRQAQPRPLDRGGQPDAALLGAEELTGAEGELAGVGAGVGGAELDGQEAAPGRRQVQGVGGRGEALALDPHPDLGGLGTGVAHQDLQAAGATGAEGAEVETVGLDQERLRGQPRRKQGAGSEEKGGGAHQKERATNSPECR